MTPAIYPAHYIDQHGEESTIIANDGTTLSMVVRGVEFRGRWFDDFEPMAGIDASCFLLNRGELCACDITVPVISGSEEFPGMLHAHLDLGQPGLDREELILRLTFEESQDVYEGRCGLFDFFEIWDRMTGVVQETYLCPEFERRRPGTGYRG